MSSTSYKKAGVLYFVANIFNKGISFITVPIFTRLLSTFDYGVVTTYSSWASILAAFLGFSLNTAIRYSYNETNQTKIDNNRALSSIFTFTILISILLLSTAIVVIVAVPISINVAIVVLCFLQGMFGALINDYTTYQMMEYKYIGRSLLMTMPNLIAAVLSVFMIIMMREHLYLGRIIPMSIMTCFFGVVLCVAVFSRTRPCIDIAYLKWALKVSVPLVIHGIALNILSQADRTMITWLRDASETGIYSLVYSFSMIATVITTALEGVWAPWYTERMNKKEYKKVNEVGRDYLNLMTYAMVALVLVSVEVLKLLADREYWSGIPVIPPIVLSNYVIFLYTLFVNVEYYYEKSIYITINTAIAAIVNILLNLVFIPRFGFFAAAYTTLASYTFSFLLHMSNARKLNKDIFAARMFVRPLLHIGLSSVLFYIYLNKPLIRWGFMIVYCAYEFIRERKRIGEYFPEVAKKYAFFR